MAISHAHLILLLLSLLFFLPTLRAFEISFENCGDKLDPVNVTSVVIFPNYSVTSLGIFGSTSETLNKGGYMNVGVKIRDVPFLTKTVDICEDMDCPVAPGDFVLSLGTFLPFRLPVKFNVHIQAFDVSAEPLMCLNFTIPKL